MFEQKIILTSSIIYDLEEVRIIEACFDIVVGLKD